MPWYRQRVRCIFLALLEACMWVLLIALGHSGTLDFGDAQGHVTPQVNQTSTKAGGGPGTWQEDISVGSTKAARKKHTFCRFWTFRKVF